jgi:hypothetical protein
VVGHPLLHLVPVVPVLQHVLLKKP